MRTIYAFALFLGGTLASHAVIAASPMVAAPSAINRIDALQIDTGTYEGTWCFYHTLPADTGVACEVTNLTGVTALGLVEAARDGNPDARRSASLQGAARFITDHLGTYADDTQLHERPTAFDIIFLHRFGELVSDASYKSRAIAEWDDAIKATYPNAQSLYDLFVAISRPSFWDLVAFGEAAYLSGDDKWADEVADLLADPDHPWYEDSTWGPLNTSYALYFLSSYGYAGNGYAETAEQLLLKLRGWLGRNCNSGLRGSVQETAYSVMAFRTVGGPLRFCANSLARWLASEQQPNGGWDLGGYEIPEVDGEALRAMMSTLGNNIGEWTRPTLPPRSYDVPEAAGASGSVVPFSP